MVAAFLTQLDNSYQKIFESCEDEIYLVTFVKLDNCIYSYKYIKIYFIEFIGVLYSYVYNYIWAQA